MGPTAAGGGRDDSSGDDGDGDGDNDGDEDDDIEMVGPSKLVRILFDTCIYIYRYIQYIMEFLIPDTHTH